MFFLFYYIKFSQQVYKAHHRTCSFLISCLAIISNYYQSLAIISKARPVSVCTGRYSFSVKWERRYSARFFLGQVFKGNYQQIHQTLFVRYSPDERHVHETRPSRVQWYWWIEISLDFTEHKPIKQGRTATVYVRSANLHYHSRAPWMTLNSHHMG